MADGTSGACAGRSDLVGARGVAAVAILFAVGVAVAGLARGLRATGRVTDMLAAVPSPVADAILAGLVPITWRAVVEISSGAISANVAGIGRAGVAVVAIAVFFTSLHAFTGFTNCVRTTASALGNRKVATLGLRAE